MAVLSRLLQKCRAACAADEQSVTVMLQLSRYSLKFPDAAMEVGFLRTRTEGLLSCFFKSIVIVFFGALLSLFGNNSRRESALCTVKVTHFEDVARVCWLMKLSLVAWAGVVLVLVKMSLVVKRLGLIQREIVVVCFLHVCMIVVVLSDFYYMGRIKSLDPQTSCPQAKFTDMRTLLVINAMFSLTHSAFPLRWCIVWSVALVGVLLYLNLGLIVGSPDRELVPTNAIFLLCIALAAGFGKRKIELHERLAYWTWVTEKSLRVHSEHQLDRISRQSSDATAQEVSQRAHDTDAYTDADSSKVGSLPSTTDTGKMFKTVESETIDRKFAELVELGLKERWLISQGNINVQASILGRGSFGIVARGSFLGTPVALKIPATKTGTQDIRKLPTILNELRILRHVRHPNIIIFHGACFLKTDRSTVVLVVELIEGITMDAWIREKVDPSGDVSWHKGLLDVCCALRYLHKQQPCIVHGDLKAANIMISRHNQSARAKLLDFGCSRVLTSNAKALGGTLVWKAPEVVRHYPKLPTVAADVFSFGCLLYFVMTGKLPLSNLSGAAIRKTLFGESMPALVWPLDARLSHSSAKILIQGCLQFDMDKRLSIDIVWADLVQWPARLCFSAGAETILREVNTKTTPQSGIPDGLVDAMDLRLGVIWARRHLDAKQCPIKKAAVLLGGEAVPVPEKEKHPKYSGESPKMSPDDLFLTLPCQLGMPSFRPTPLNIQLAALKMVMQYLNLPQPLDSCCEFHAAAQAVGQLVSKLRDEQCPRKWHEKVEGQCPECGTLILGPIDSPDTQLMMDLICPSLVHTAALGTDARKAGASSGISMGNTIHPSELAKGIAACMTPIAEENDVAAASKFLVSDSCNIEAL